MKMFQASAILASAMIIKMLCGIYLIKLFATRLSVEEFGQVGQYMTLIAVLTTLAGGAQVHGLIKILSAKTHDKTSVQKILRTSHFLLYTSTLVVCILLFVFAYPLTNVLLNDTKFVWLLLPIAIGFCFAGFNNIQIATLSAFGKIKFLAISQAVGIVIGTVFAIFLLIQYDVRGAIAGFGMLGIWNALSSFYFTRKAKVISFSDMKPVKDWAILKQLFSYSTALVLAVLMMPGAHIFARAELAQAVGWKDVGYWQAITRLSDAVIQVFGTFFNNYVLAILAKMQDYKPTKDFLTKVVIWVCFASIVLYITIFALRDLYITIMLTPEYIVIGDLLPYQFSGDVLRLVAAVGSYYFLAQKRLKWYVGMEAIAAITFSICVIYFIPIKSGAAPVFAHLITYALFFAIISAHAMRALLKTRPQN